MGLYISLNDNQQCLLMVHIPKTAGTSLFKALHRNKYRATRPYPKYSFQNVRRKLKGIKLPGVHGKANDYKTVLGELVWEDIFSFAFVRNPWDLMISSYFWWLQIAPKSNKKEVCEQAEEIRRLGSFSTFVNSVYGSEMINDQYGNMVDWITDEQHQIIVKFVGKFENLEADWQCIGKILNLEDTKLPHHNKSIHFSYQDYYNTQTQKLIEHRFEWVIQQFKYRF